MKNTISVIIPVMNDETYLIRCLNNLKRQTESPLEIIIAEENVAVNTTVAENVFCLATEDKLVPPQINIAQVPQKKDFSEFIFDEERRIATNINKAIALAHGEYIFFYNITSILNLKLFDTLKNNICSDKLCSINPFYFNGKSYQLSDNAELLWGKLFNKELLQKNKLSKWNYLEILRWVDHIQSNYDSIINLDETFLYEESYDELIQRTYTVKLKDDIPKYKKYFIKRIKDGRDLFENINTYDYVKVNIITSLMEQCISDPNLVVELTDKYILPIYENRLNAKKNRKELLHTALCDFFASIEKDETQYEVILMLFGMNKRTCEIFKTYNFEISEKILKRWNTFNH